MGEVVAGSVLRSLMLVVAVAVDRGRFGRRKVFEAILFGYRNLLGRRVLQDGEEKGEESEVSSRRISCRETPCLSAHFRGRKID